MDGFTKTSKGYDPKEVNQFLDAVIAQVEEIIKDSKKKTEKLQELASLEQENKRLKDKIATYQRLEKTLNNSILMASKTATNIKANAEHEAEITLNDAKQNANRIINEALIRSEKIENSADLLKRNVTIYKKRLRSLIETQLELVDDIEKIEF